MKQWLRINFNKCWRNYFPKIRCHMTSSSCCRHWPTSSLKTAQRFWSHSSKNPLIVQIPFRVFNYFRISKRKFRLSPGFFVLSLKKSSQSRWLRGNQSQIWKVKLGRYHQDTRDGSQRRSFWPPISILNSAWSTFKTSSVCQRQKVNFELIND